MRRRLFLTGPMGCGKSTAMERALGGRMARCGGFRTRRTRDEAGHALSFSLISPDGTVEETFLDFSTGKPVIRMEVFEQTSIRMMEGKFLILDEIGGFELLSPVFREALDRLLASDTPILGVLKGESAANALIRALGLSEEYEQAARELHHRLRNDPDTLVFECGQYDPEALRLAEQWVREYAHE